MMAVMGIQNFDKMTKRVELMSKACSGSVVDKAMEAAGDVLADALAAGTPIGSQSHKRSKGGMRSGGNARNSVINVSAKSKTYGVTRRLVGYSKEAFYMLWVLKGHQMVAGGRRKRGAAVATNTHSQGGKGQVVGWIQGRNFMHSIFRANIKHAMAAAKDVFRRAARGQLSTGRRA
jgi:hypothetical protein